MDDEYELTAEVTEYVATFYAEAETPEDAFEFSTDEVDYVAPEIAQAEEVVEVMTEEGVPDVIAAAQSIVPGQWDYLLKPISEWTEADWSQQAFGEPGHHWDEFGFA